MSTIMAASCSLVCCKEEKEFDKAVVGKDRFCLTVSHIHLKEKLIVADSLFVNIPRVYDFKSTIFLSYTWIL